MKKHVLHFLALASCAVAATNDPSPALQGKSATLPSISVTISNPPGRLTFLTAADTLSHTTNSASSAHRKFVSKMPIISPKAGLDTNMIKTPDSSIDYKLTVKTPDIESVK